MRVLVTRPEEDGADLVETLERRAIECLLEPLMAVSYRDDAEPDLTGVQAILITSANGARALARTSEARGVAVFAVGDASARAAREAGYGKVESAGGDVETLTELVTQRLDASGGPLFHAAGSALAGDLAGKLAAAGFDVRREVLYDAVPSAALSPAAIAAIKNGKLDGVLLFSPRTAVIFADLVRKARLIRSARELTAYCLSDAVAEAASDLPWRAVRIAARPTQEDLIDLLAAPTGAPAAVPRQSAPDHGAGKGYGEHDDGESEDTVSVDETSLLPHSPAPGVSIVRPAKTRGGLTAFFVTVLVLAAFVGGLAATMPYWVPEIAPYLPGRPPPPPDPRLAQLTGRFDDLEQRAADQRNEVAARRAENSRVLADLDAERARLNEQLERTMARVETLEGALAEMRRRVEAAAGTPGDAEAAETALKELADRLARIEAAGLQSDARDHEKIETLARKVAELESRAVERRQAAADLEVRAFEFALGQLRSALDESRPFGEELAALASVAADDPEIAEVAATLEAYAGTGIPTLAELRARFDELAGALSAPAPDGAATGQGWVDRALARLGRLVRIRRVDGQGTGNDAVIARAESRLDAGDLEGAVSALAGLDDAGQVTAADWLATARARFAAERALARLEVLLTSQKRAADG
jgi:uroporphyrinogen-III synthase